MDDNEDSNDSIEVVSASPLAMSSADSAMINMQVEMAHRYPRNITKFKRNALLMATSDEDVAAACFYKLPRGGKIIEGASIRLAEIVASSWGNLRMGARIVAEEERWIVAQSVVYDLEINNTVTMETRRRITDSKGRRFNDDLITNVSNAATSIALRNAILRVIPKIYVDAIYDAAKKVAIGDASTLVERRGKALEYFQKLGVQLDRILLRLGKAGVDDVDIQDLELLTGLRTAIKDEGLSVDEAFPSAVAVVNGTDAGASKTENLADKLKKQLTVEDLGGGK